MRKFVTMVLSLALSLSLFAGCGSATVSSTISAGDATSVGAPESAPVQTRTLVMSSTLSTAEYEKQNTGMAVMFKALADKIPEATNGEIQVKLYLDGQLASGSADIINGVLSNAIDIANVGSGNLNEYTDAAVAIGVPFAFVSRDVANEVLTGDFGTKINDKIQNDLNVKPLAWLDLGFRQTTNNVRQIRTPADVKGLKIRTMSDSLQIAAWEQLGASCSTIAYNELFTALQQNVVDAQENPVSNIYNKRFYEVQKYMSTTSHSFFASMFFMNLDTWNSFTDSQKVAISKIAAEAASQAREVDIKSQQELLDEMAATGIEIYYLNDEEISAFKEAISPVYAQAEKLIGSERWTEFKNAIVAAEKSVK